MEWINFQLHILIKNFIFYKTHEMTKSWSILQDAKQEILQIRLEQVSGLMHIWQTDHYNMVSWLNQNRNCLLVKTKQMRLNFYEVYIVGIYIYTSGVWWNANNEWHRNAASLNNHVEYIRLVWPSNDTSKYLLSRWCSTIRASVFLTHPMVRQPHLISSYRSFDNDRGFWNWECLIPLI